MKESDLFEFFDLFEFRDVEFSFQVTGVRDGFEDEEVVVDIAGNDDRKNIPGNAGQTHHQPPIPPCFKPMKHPVQDCNGRPYS